MMNLSHPLPWLVPATALLLSGCSAVLNRVTVRRVIPGVMALDDLDVACHYGDAVIGAIVSIKPDDPADKPALLAAAAAGICAETEARELRLLSQLYLSDLDNTGRVQLSTDARIRSERSYTVAARRYAAAWQQTLDVYGLDCPRMSTRDEALYLVGLIAGDLSLITDAAAASPLGIPQNTILEVARGAACLDDAKWWGVPSALQGAAWATVPGSAPEGVDPWALLEAAAATGDAAGVRVARSLQAFTAANAGSQDVLEAAIIAHADARQTPGDPKWVLLDEYALSVSLFESDQLWIAAAGQRTAAFGTLPGGSDVGEDPFGSDEVDPFGTPPSTPPHPLEDEETP